MDNDRTDEEDNKNLHFLRLKASGKSFSKNQKYQEALKKFEEAYEIIQQESLKRKIDKLKEYLANNTDDKVTVADGFKLSKALCDQLYEYQKEGLRWMWGLHQQGKGGILGDEMGLGKTVQIISFLTGLMEAGEIKTALIVMPVSLIQNWEAEIGFWSPYLRHRRYHGSSSAIKENNLRSIQNRGGVLFTSYGMIVSSGGILSKRLDETKFKWDYIILDEGHKIKNPTKTTKSIHELVAGHRLVLTETPIQNNLKELWSLYDFCHQGALLGTLTTFKTKYETPINRSREKDATVIEKNLGCKIAENLRDLIAPYFIRRTKADTMKSGTNLRVNGKTCANLPKKNELIVWIRLSEQQIDIYQKFLESDVVREILTENKLNPLVYLVAMKKICNHPRLFSVCARSQLRGQINLDEIDDEISVPNDLVADHVSLNVDPSLLLKESGKMEVLIKLLENLKKEGHRTLVFSLSTKVLDIIQKILMTGNWKVLRLDGTVRNLDERQRRINLFQNSTEYSVFLLTTQVEGVGLNLTGADRVVIYEPSWNPAIDTRAVNRAYRIGQTKDVVVYRFITCGSIEEKIYNREIFKESITRQVICNEVPYRYFTKNQLRELFVLDDPLSSKTQIQFKKIHEHLKNTTPELEDHIDQLQGMIGHIFGISHHDLVFHENIQDDSRVREDDEIIQQQPEIISQLAAFPERTVAEFSPASTSSAHLDLNIAQFEDAEVSSISTQSSTSRPDRPQNSNDSSTKSDAKSIESQCKISKREPQSSRESIRSVSARKISVVANQSPYKYGVPKKYVRSRNFVATTNVGPRRLIQSRSNRKVSNVTKKFRVTKIERTKKIESSSLVSSSNHSNESNSPLTSESFSKPAPAFSLSVSGHPSASSFQASSANQFTPEINRVTPVVNKLELELKLERKKCLENNKIIEELSSRLLEKNKVIKILSSGLLRITKKVVGLKNPLENKPDDLPQSNANADGELDLDKELELLRLSLNAAARQTKEKTKSEINTEPRDASTSRFNFKSFEKERVGIKKEPIDLDSDLQSKKDAKYVVNLDSDDDDELPVIFVESKPSSYSGKNNFKYDLTSNITELPVSRDKTLPGIRANDNSEELKTVSDDEIEKRTFQNDLREKTIDERRIERELESSMEMDDSLDQTLIPEIVCTTPRISRLSPTRRRTKDASVSSKSMDSSARVNDGINIATPLVINSEAKKIVESSSSNSEKLRKPKKFRRIINFTSESDSDSENTNYSTDDRLRFNRKIFVISTDSEDSSNFYKKAIIHREKTTAKRGAPTDFNDSKNDKRFSSSHPSSEESCKTIASNADQSLPKSGIRSEPSNVDEVLSSHSSLVKRSNPVTKLVTNDRESLPTHRSQIKHPKSLVSDVNETSPRRYSSKERSKVDEPRHNRYRSKERSKSIASNDEAVAKRGLTENVKTNQIRPSTSKRSDASTSSGRNLKSSSSGQTENQPSTSKVDDNSNDNAKPSSKWLTKKEATNVLRRKPWSFEEEELLYIGVQKYGVGHWYQIATKYGIQRSSQQLYDKWRNLGLGNNKSKVELRVQGRKKKVNKTCH